ncbi:MAG: hypothetical protein H3C28_04900 [Sphingomonadales bacterium]|nr:hypothetical protein [Sphingomonadales bacterium]
MPPQSRRHAAASLGLATKSINLQFKVEVTIGAKTTTLTAAFVVIKPITHSISSRLSATRRSVGLMSCAAFRRSKDWRYVMNEDDFLAVILGQQSLDLAKLRNPGSSLEKDYTDQLRHIAEVMLRSLLEQRPSESEAGKLHPGNLTENKIDQCDPRVAAKLRAWLTDAKKNVATSSVSGDYHIKLIVEFFNICVERIAEEERNPSKPLKGKKPKIKKKVEIVEVGHDYASIYLERFYEYCAAEAIYDLLSGNLHNLDAAINDAGCQWRVPFVLDLYNDLWGHLLTYYSIDGIENAIACYAENRLNLVSMQQFEMFRTYKDWVTSYNKEKPKKIGGYPAFWEKKAKLLDNFLQELFTAPSMVEDEKGAVNFLRICTRAENFIKNWKLDIFSPHTALRYLTCCKIYTLRHIRHMDCFGLSSVPEDIDVTMPEQVRRGVVSTIAECPYNYMKYVVKYSCLEEGVEFDPESGAIVDDTQHQNKLTVSIYKQIMQPFKIKQLEVSYPTHVFYGPFRAILAYQCHKNQPLIIDLRRLICKKIGEEYRYGFNGGQILYYEPHDGQYVYVPSPSEDQRNYVSMCIEAYSILTVDENGRYIGQGNYDDVDLGFISPDFNTYIDAVTTANIINLILPGAALHGELPTNLYNKNDLMEDLPGLISDKDHDTRNNLIKRVYESSTPNRCQNQTIYFQTLVGPQVPLLNCQVTAWDIITEKEACIALFEKFGIDTAAYRRFEMRDVVNTNTKKPKRERVGLRIANTIPFAPIHIYGCTFAIKQRELEYWLGEIGCLGQDYTDPQIIRGEIED